MACNRCVISVLNIPQSACNVISAEMYLFAVCWSQGQIVQAVRGHIPNSIEEPGVSDRLHTQLPRQEMKS